MTILRNEEVELEVYNILEGAPEYRMRRTELTGKVVEATGRGNDVAEAAIKALLGDEELVETGDDISLA